MAHEREIAIRISSLADLLEIVAAIRAMAASQMQQALRSLEPIRSYSDTIRATLADAAQLLPLSPAERIVRPTGKSAIVVFSAEHGLCGGFNEQPLRTAASAIEQSAEKPLLIVAGSRGAQICLERGLSADRVLPMATHCSGVTAAARRIADELYRRFSRGEVSTVEVIYAQHRGNPAAPVTRERLLPIDPTLSEPRSSRMPPLTNLEPRRLFEDIAGEYFFATLENAAMQSFFSENSTRFRTMEAAHQNIQNKSKELTRLARRLRQEDVTTEILDLIAGSEAISSR